MKEVEGFGRAGREGKGGGAQWSGIEMVGASGGASGLTVHAVLDGREGVVLDRKDLRPLLEQAEEVVVPLSLFLRSEEAGEER